MERPRCKICCRAFSNGRALGGHMRSHLVTLPIPPKKQTESTLFCSSDEDGKVFIYGLRENPKKSLRSVDPKFVDVVDQERESETESTKNPTRKRSKRIRGVIKSRNGEKPSSTESVSNTSPKDEDVAMCLMMLSRDVWCSDESLSHKKCSPVQYREESGHRKRTGVKSMTSADVKLHECPFCYKVFGSGQALGGHKRAHLLVSSSPSGGGGGGSLVNSGKLSDNLLIDLNLPPPMEDDEQVSDAEFHQSPFGHFQH